MCDSNTYFLNTASQQPIHHDLSEHQQVIPSYLMAMI